MKNQKRIVCEAHEILDAAINAVGAERLVADALNIDDRKLSVGGKTFARDQVKRIVMVGGGKASGEMARGLVAELKKGGWDDVPRTGWVNVPEENQFELPGIVIHAARPRGENLPTQQAIHGTLEIIRLVSSLQTGDLCFVLISGGGSALLCQPVSTVTLDDKRQVTKILSARGATIEQLNLVRQSLSDFKAGGLLNHLTGGSMVALIICDVLGDRLDLVASGPTVPSLKNRAELARDVRNVFRALAISESELPENIRFYLNELPGQQRKNRSRRHGECLNVMIGNLPMAMAAAERFASSLGYKCQTEIQSPTKIDDADELGRACAQKVLSQITKGGRQCWIYGGEPIVKLVAAPGRGGRNQQLMLAAIDELLHLTDNSGVIPGDFCLLSSGTDGEDGTSPIAGAWIDLNGLDSLKQARFDPAPFLAANDAFSFFMDSPLAIDRPKTTTNIGDLRILLTNALPNLD